MTQQRDNWRAFLQRFGDDKPEPYMDFTHEQDALEFFFEVIRAVRGEGYKLQTIKLETEGQDDVLTAAVATAGPPACTSGPWVLRIQRYDVVDVPVMSYGQAYDTVGAKWGEIF
jgi:hypothetical protein